MKLAKNKLKTREKKNKANPGKLYKPKLIFQTCNSLNSRLKLNQEAKHLTDKMLKDKIIKKINF
jgi:hypothetical protein